jgi:ketosteroid isomerase-like protein
MGRVQDLDAFLRSYERASNSHDFDQVLPLVADDAVYWFSNGTHVGLAAIRKAFESTWAAIADEDYRITDVRWLVANDDAAACVYTYSWSGLVGGQRRSGNGRGTNVLTRTETGWHIVHEHLSSPSGL